MPPHQDRVDLAKEMDVAKTHRHHFLLWPKLWAEFKDNTALTWTSVPFDIAQVPNIPDKQGVYAFIVMPDASAGLRPSYLLYVGETTDQTLRERFKQYVRGVQNLTERPKLIATLPKYSGFIHFHFAVVPANMKPEDIEDKLLSGFVPPLNSKFKGKVSAITNAFI